MKRTRSSETQYVAILKQAFAGIKVTDLSQKHEIVRRPITIGKRNAAVESFRPQTAYERWKAN